MGRIIERVEESKVTQVEALVLSLTDSHFPLRLFVTNLPLSDALQYFLSRLRGVLLRVRYGENLHSDWTVQPNVYEAWPLNSELHGLVGSYEMIEKIHKLWWHLSEKSKIGY